MTSFNVEEIDLAELAAAVAQRCDAVALEGFVVGKTLLRDAVLSILACSELEAEQLVDTLVARGYLRFEADPGALGTGMWRIGGL